MTIQILPESELLRDATVEYFSLTIRLSTQGPQFERVPTATPLYCDENDESWAMEIPGIKYQDLIDAIVRLDPRNSRNRLFEIDKLGRLVIA